MFSSLSWSVFIVFTSLVVLAYYVSIVCMYYRKQVTNFLFPHRGHLRKGMLSAVKEGPDHLLKVHELISELGQIIRSASEGKPQREEMLFAMQLKIRDFLILEPTAYKGRINAYIAEELEIYGIPGIHAEEIENLWKP